MAEDHEDIPERAAHKSIDVMVTDGDKDSLLADNIASIVKNASLV